ncbi:general substrate transporter [Phyllosticta capitalensis]|uniref:General substrate transporter n=1 Tax=Phyllosticta capitalensis TaxID=121624 RepID=A0ABR1Z067_9PEZI
MDDQQPAEKVSPSSSGDVTPAVQEKSKRNGGVSVLAVFLSLVASTGGFMFGYQSGQISGFLEMDDYKRRFGEPQADGSHTFSASRQGAIVGLFSIGCLMGCLTAGKVADTLGRRLTISLFAFVAIIGSIIEVASTTHWAQFAVGRLVDGMGIGALSATVPMYQSESAPPAIRGSLIALYQLFVTLGIWFAELVNFGTETRSDSGSWRITGGLSFAFALILGIGILFLPESPRYAYRAGRVDEARNTMARLANLEPYDPVIESEIQEIQQKLDEDKANSAAGYPWYEIFTAPRMFYRTALGVVIQAGSQLTGANFFFYYGTTIFSATGLQNSFETQVILGSVNVFCTFGGIYVAQRCGRRISLIVGSAWMFMCFMVFSFVGQYLLNHDDPQSTPTAGNVMIVFACLFLAAFATTWGPLSWAVVAELYPSAYRAKCMALATASNWLFNFLISFFTTFITNAIDYFYGLVFAGCCFALIFVIFFFVIESQGRSLEEIDTMYTLKVNPITSAKWKPQKDVPATGE